MKKVSSIFILIAIGLLLSLVGCSQKQPPAPNEPSSMAVGQAIAALNTSQFTTSDPTSSFVTSIAPGSYWHNDGPITFKVKDHDFIWKRFFITNVYENGTFYWKEFSFDSTDTKWVYLDQNSRAAGVSKAITFYNQSQNNYNMVLASSNNYVIFYACKAITTGNGFDCHEGKWVAVPFTARTEYLTIKNFAEANLNAEVGSMLVDTTPIVFSFIPSKLYDYSKIFELNGLAVELSVANADKGEYKTVKYLGTDRASVGQTITNISGNKYNLMIPFRDFNKVNYFSVLVDVPNTREDKKYEISLKMDPINDISEIAENSQTQSVSFTVANQPLGTIADFKVSGITNISGGPAPIKGMVNQGTIIGVKFEMLRSNNSVDITQDIPIFVNFKTYNVKSVTNYNQPTQTLILHKRTEGIHTNIYDKISFGSNRYVTKYYNVTYEKTGVYDLIAEINTPWTGQISVSTIEPTTYRDSEKNKATYTNSISISTPAAPNDPSLNPGGSVYTDASGSAAGPSNPQ